MAGRKIGDTLQTYNRNAGQMPVIYEQYMSQQHKDTRLYEYSS